MCKHIHPQRRNQINTASPTFITSFINQTLNPIQLSMIMYKVLLNLSGMKLHLPPNREIISINVSIILART